MRSPQRSLVGRFTRVFFEIFLRVDPELRTIFPTTFLWICHFSYSFLLHLSQVVDTVFPSHEHLRDSLQA